MAFSGKSSGAKPGAIMCPMKQPGIMSLGGYTARPFGLRYLLEEENKGDGAPAGSAGAPKAEQKPSPSEPPEVASLKARVAAFEAAEAKRTQDEAKAADEAKAKAKADGDLKAQLELQAKELEKLKGLQEDAELGKSFREREEKRIDEARAKLSPEQAAFLDAQPSIALKAQAVDLFLRPGTEKKPGEPAKNGAPAGEDVDYAAALRDPQKWAELKKKDPDGTSKFIRSQMDGSRPGNTKPLAFLH